MNRPDSCIHYLALIDSYVNKTAAPAQNAVLFSHLGQCSLCARRLMESFIIKKTMAAWQTTMDDALSQQVFMKIVADKNEPDEKTEKEEPGQIISRYMARVMNGNIGIGPVMNMTQDLVAWAARAAEPALAG
jgi:hypothetical protein